MSNNRILEITIVFERNICLSSAEKYNPDPSFKLHPAPSSQLAKWNINST